MLDKSYQKIAVFGGIYNNYLALEEAIKSAKSNNVEQIFCLGDLGAFGPYPDRVFPLLIENNIKVMQGNYDNSISNNIDNCQCGYTDPLDNYFAQISYEYTYKNTSEKYKLWMKELPEFIKIQLGKYKIHMSHGSPRQMNEFLWESATSEYFLKKLFKDYYCDILLATHTGIKWLKQIDDNYFINVGVLGRPENDGQTNVWYTILEIENNSLKTEFIPVYYDYNRLAKEMKRENLPDEFIQTILTGYWTTCLDILPVKERLKGKF